MRISDWSSDVCSSDLGHWYPHRKDPISFSRALMNQCLGTLRGMRAIRAVIPSAQFLQTEDLGKVFSTRPLRYQAAYENERRWLSLDMLSGRVEPGHRFQDRKSTRLNSSH